MEANNVDSVIGSRADGLIEVDSGGDEDSGFGDEISRFTASIRSSVLEYPIENGRRYHAFRSGVYCLPNDELEQDRLDLTHVLMTTAIGGKLFLAPVDAGRIGRVLDIGAGTGIWSMAMGEEFPNLEVIGNDLSAIQPQWVPSNVRFIVDDIESPWPPQPSFDFIFCRYMAACIENWPQLVERVYENLNPTGWAEFQDFDLVFHSQDGSSSLPPSTCSNIIFWSSQMFEAVRLTSREPHPGPHLEQWVRAAGFTNVHCQRFSLPIGSWAKEKRLKEVGLLNLAQILDGLEAFSLRCFCQVLGWEREEVLELLEKVRAEMMNRRVHLQLEFYVVYGQKDCM
ncbi:S-adenosyl-L-methionine-dependent methyltransferase [Cercophora newfieldiana]|uniref:S-adenosyl-L-methionine-dependent methyltransferase n=1 Tax=Cercophora newfieldiana TaxID=92897 RepID=A0AA39XSL5_9PEZI|nr:S-adenosyl-L-methionine-dependent methyltransferase [Cercophora newfieldiana]